MGTGPRGGRRSTGPITEQGKSRSSMNAVKHGALSTKLLLPSENPQEYAQLLQDICDDLRPVGAMERILVEKIAAAVWRKRRLEGAEQALATSAEKRTGTVDDLQKALGLDSDQYPPERMLDEANVPDEAAGAFAVAMCNECARFNTQRANSEQEAMRNYPKIWAKLVEDAHYLNLNEGPIAYLRQFEPLLMTNATSTHAFRRALSIYVKSLESAYRWDAYWHQNPDKVAAAHCAIRAANLVSGWNLDQSHRYHTMLDNQLFKLMQEFRATRKWRLSTLELVDIDDEGGTRSATATR